MRWRWWLGLALLGPLLLVAVGTYLAGTLIITGVAQAGLGVRNHDSARVQIATKFTQRGAAVLEWTWNSPSAKLLALNPLTLGAVDDLGQATKALVPFTKTLSPLAEIGGEIVGFDGEPPLISGSTVDTARLADLAAPIAELNHALAETSRALSQVHGTGPLGRPVGAAAESFQGTVSDLAKSGLAVERAWPALPAALGAEEPRRYLICALNDAESFGSGGAPLSAFVVQAVRGNVSVPISGQLESKLSPDNPPIRWKHAGGVPWYRQNGKYPFVNANFHPDFRTASKDLQRAWAALGYPEVEGVVTVDVSAIAEMLAWVGPVDAPGYGRVSSKNLIEKVLVDAYRQFDSPDGVLERHSRNDELSAALGAHLTQTANVVSALRGALASIGPRHIQAGFQDPDLQGAVVILGASGALSDGTGDLIGTFSQSGPNKLSVFQERTIVQHVQLDSDGGASVRRTVTTTNKVPVGLPGDANTYAGYTALRARLRTAHRLPLQARSIRLSTGTAIPLVPPDRTGPFPDGRGGVVLWQGNDIEPRASNTIEIRYRLPPGTFNNGGYEAWADPQALPSTPTLSVHVTPASGMSLPASAGWLPGAAGTLVWSGSLDRALHLSIGAASMDSP